MQVWERGRESVFYSSTLIVKGGCRSLKPKKLGLSHEVTNFNNKDFSSSLN